MRKNDRDVRTGNAAFASRVFDIVLLIVVQFSSLKSQAQAPVLRYAVAPIRGPLTAKAARV